MNNKELSFLDVLNILSFMIGIMNLETNVTQTDKQDLERNLTNELQNTISEVHNHLELQDNKIDKILEVLQHE